MSDTAEKFAFTWDRGEPGTGPGDEIPTIESAVFQALGAASTCWDSTGVFLSERAKEIGDTLVAFIASKQPMLGYASTHDLIRELCARAEVAKAAGEDWPNYLTVDTDGG